MLQYVSSHPSAKSGSNKEKGSYFSEDLMGFLRSKRLSLRFHCFLYVPIFALQHRRPHFRSLLTHSLNVDGSSLTPFSRPITCSLTDVLSGIDSSTAEGNVAFDQLQLEEGNDLLEFISFHPTPLMCCALDDRPSPVE